MNSQEIPGLYIHTPFCRSKCFYCDFYSVASRAEIPAWLEAVRAEMKLYKEEFPAFDSLYLGGGTPSVLEERDLAALLESILQNFAFGADPEMTMEANPESLSPEKLKTLRDFGLNRISLGVQSLEDSDLKYLGRAHSAGQALRAFEACRSAGFSNVSVDLIYGLETQSLKSWKKTLDTILELRPEHISCYQLTFEKGTALWKKKEAGRVRSIGEKMEAAFFLWTSRYLQRRGYCHYEVSNFAAGREFLCRHNRKYWRHVPYLGLGPSAHSLAVVPQPRRWWNVKSVREYCRLLGEGKAPVAGWEFLSREQFDLETFDLALRTDEGLDMAALKDYPQSQRVLAQWQKSGLVRLSEGRVRPTRRGFLVADSLAVMLAG
ncbi:MAG: radical SAM family heme chaperone HemW [Syntrophobacteraceae bacterium]|nr:radical SAM family heme chaperone HemW [Syntrophobacteraceae bacterium]